MLKFFDNAKGIFDYIKEFRVYFSLLFRGRTKIEIKQHIFNELVD